jgi:hypothetical protein
MELTVRVTMEVTINCKLDSLQELEFTVNERLRQTVTDSNWDCQSQSSFEVGTAKTKV